MKYNVKSDNYIISDDLNKIISCQIISIDINEELLDDKEFILIYFTRYFRSSNAKLHLFAKT